MDSVTQAALGAAVSYAGWHRPLGRWSLVWGVGFGSLPDLDVLASPWMDRIEFLYWHRGPSHGVLFLLVATLAGAALVRGVHRSRPPPWVSALSVTAAILVTHVAIDLFTVYGTQLLAPFSNHGYGTNNLFIIDPLFTGPLLVGILLAVTLRTPQARARANSIGLALSTAYVGWSFVAQARADAVFARAREVQGISATQTMTSATALNTLLWRHVAATEGGFLIGYWSWLDADETVRFDFVPQQAHLVEAEQGTRAMEVVRWFSQGYWVAAGSPEDLRVSDLRFGELRSDPGAPAHTWSYIFSWRIGAGARDPSGLESLPQDFAGRSDAFGQVWRRIRGDRSVW
jgi:inner membrane protein